MGVRLAVGCAHNMKNLTGEKSYNRIIIGLSDEKQGGHWKWSYECTDCKRKGKIRESEWLKSGCFCTRKAKPIIDMTGQRYGKWAATNKHKIGVHSHSEWWCVCDCGNEDWVSRPNLISGGSTNCGCVYSINWNGMGFHSLWEVYIAMVMRELKITYYREKDKISVIHPDFPDKNIYYIPDFTIVDKNNVFTHWVEVKGNNPNVLNNEWKALQIADKFKNLIMIRDDNLDEILGCKQAKLKYLYSKGGFPLVQDKINQIMQDEEHASRIRKMLLFD